MNNKDLATPTGLPAEQDRAAGLRPQPPAASSQSIIPSADGFRPPFHTSISLEQALQNIRNGDIHWWSGAVYDHLRNYQALLAQLSSGKSS